MNELSPLQFEYTRALSQYQALAAKLTPYQKRIADEAESSLNEMNKLFQSPCWIYFAKRVQKCFQPVHASESCVTNEPIEAVMCIPAIKTPTYTDEGNLISLFRFRPNSCQEGWDLADGDVYCGALQNAFIQYMFQIVQSERRYLETKQAALERCLHKV